MYQSIVNSDTNARHELIVEVLSRFYEGKKIAVIGDWLGPNFSGRHRLLGARNSQERLSAWAAAARMDADVIVVDGASREEESTYMRDLGFDVIVGFPS